MLAGVITGIFGGLLRDILCTEVPMVLRRELYATVALFTGVLYVTLLWLGIDIQIASLVALASGFLLRMLAIRFGWRLPQYDPEDIRGLD